MPIVQEKLEEMQKRVQKTEQLNYDITKGIIITITTIITTTIIIDTVDI